jgi:hypothetical protein
MIEERSRVQQHFKHQHRFGGHTQRDHRRHLDAHQHAAKEVTEPLCAVANYVDAMRCSASLSR